MFPRRLHRVTALLILILLTFCGLYLRWIHGRSFGMWDDEISNSRVCNQSATFREFVHGILSVKQAGGDPPLYYLLSYFSAHQSANPSDVRIRIISLICGILALPMTYLAARKFGRRSTALLAAALVATNHAAVYFSMEARSYALFVLVSLFFFHAAGLFLEQATAKRVGYLLLTAILALYTHYFAILMVLPILGMLAIHCYRRDRSRKRTTILRCCGFAAVLTLLYLPPILYSVVLIRYSSSIVSSPTEASIGAYKEWLTMQPVNIPRDIQYAFATYGDSAPPFNYLRYFSFLLMCVGLAAVWIRRPLLYVALIVFFFATIIGTRIFYDTFRTTYVWRRNIFLLPVYLWLVAEGISHTARLAGLLSKRYSPRLRRGTFAFLATFYIVAQLAIYIKYSKGGHREYPDWPRAVEMISNCRAPGDRVVLVAPKTPPHWVQYSFYHRRFLADMPLDANLETTAIQAMRGSASIWVLVPSADVPTSTASYLATEGKWIPLFMSYLVYLPRLGNAVPATIHSLTDTKAISLPWQINAFAAPPQMPVFWWHYWLWDGLACGAANTWQYRLQISPSGATQVRIDLRNNFRAPVELSIRIDENAWEQVTLQPDRWMVVSTQPHGISPGQHTLTLSMAPPPPTPVVEETDFLNGNSVFFRRITVR